MAYITTGLKLVFSSLIFAFGYVLLQVFITAVRLLNFDFLITL